MVAGDLAHCGMRLGSVVLVHVAGASLGVANAWRSNTLSNLAGRERRAVASTRLSSRSRDRLRSSGCPHALSGHGRLWPYRGALCMRSWESSVLVAGRCCPLAGHAPVQRGKQPCTGVALSGCNPAPSAIQRARCAIRGDVAPGQVVGSSGGDALCKSVGLAYAGSNPAPATSCRRAAIGFHAGGGPFVVLGRHRLGGGGVPWCAVRVLRSMSGLLVGRSRMDFVCLGLFGGVVRSDGCLGGRRWLDLLPAVRAGRLGGGI